MKTGAKLLVVLMGVIGVFGLAVNSASAAGGVVINEFSANPGAGDTDWVELYNSGAEAVSLDGWYLRDTAASNLKTFGSDDVIPSGGFFVAQVGSRLGNLNDTIELYSPSGLTDSIVYPDQVIAPGLGTSAGRMSDGAAEWQVFAMPSKGVSNFVAAPTYGEIRVHAVIEINDNGFPDFPSGEPHQAGVQVRVYDANWNLVDQGTTTGKVFGKSLRFTLETGSYTICQTNREGYQQSFAKTITGWYSVADTSTANLSGQGDEYESCVAVTVNEDAITSHVFGVQPIVAQ